MKITWEMHRGPSGRLVASCEVLGQTVEGIDEEDILIEIQQTYTDLFGFLLEKGGSSAVLAWLQERGVE